jgi:hypothetical protein
MTIQTAVGYRRFGTLATLLVVAALAARVYPTPKLAALKRLMPEVYRETAVLVSVNSLRR